MEDPILQVKIEDLDTYEQLDPTDPNYVDPSTIFIPLAHDSWDMPRKMSLQALAELIQTLETT